MGGAAGALKLFYGKHVIAILKTCSTRLELRNYSRTYRNNAILPFDYNLSIRAVYYGNPFDFYPFNTNDHRYPYLNSIYK